MNVHSQSVDNIRNQREKLLKEIENTTKLIQSKRSTRETTFQQLNLISREVVIREQMLNDLQREISLIEHTIESNQVQINLLESEIQLLRSEYARLLQDTYLRRNALDEMIFFMSASNFSEAYLRFRLLKEYSRYRQNQGKSLIESQNRLIGLLENIKAQKEQKERSLALLEKEFNTLGQSQKEKNRLITALQQEEQWLLRSLREKEELAKKLENQILEYIRSASVGTHGTDFSNFMGKLIWPVHRGVIVSRFGEHEHPVLKNVTVKNNGIDIQSVGGDDVYSVHQGEVSRIVGIPGYNTAVIMRHGKFLTVYANLRLVTVKQGQKVNAGDIIGKVFKESAETAGILHFEIWNENVKLDPAKWLMP
jgi:murein hydrolase activator